MILYNILNFIYTFNDKFSVNSTFIVSCEATLDNTKNVPSFLPPMMIREISFYTYSRTANIWLVVAPTAL